MLDVVRKFKIVWFRLFVWETQFGTLVILDDGSKLGFGAEGSKEMRRELTDEED